VVNPDGRLRRPGAAVADHRLCLNGGYSLLEVECHRCKSRASTPLDVIGDRAIRRSGSLRRRRNADRATRGDTRRPVHMIKLTQITPYVWVHPAVERRDFRAALW
jgi:hypothetical protein